jgi:hypothetical protein
MHNIIKKLLIKYLKYAGFDEIRTDFCLTVNGEMYKPDVYVRKIIKNEKRIFEAIFEIVISHLEFQKIFSLLGKINSKFFIVTYSDNFIDYMPRDINKIHGDKIKDCLKIVELKSIID